MSRPRGRPPHPDVLTPSEWAVVQLVRHGLTNRRIAELRGTSHDAAKQHVANAVAKLGLRDRASLRRWAGIPAGSARRRSVQKGGVMAATPEQVQLGQIGQVSLPVTDIERSVAFYRDTLGLPHLYTFGPWPSWTAPGPASTSLRAARTALRSRLRPRSSTFRSPTSAPPTTRCASAGSASSTPRTASTPTRTAPRSGCPSSMTPTGTPLG